MGKWSQAEQEGRYLSNAGVTLLVYWASAGRGGFEEKSNGLTQSSVAAESRG